MLMRCWRKWVADAVDRFLMISTVLQQCSGSDTVEMVNAGFLLAVGRRGLIRLAALRFNLLMGDRDT